MLRSFLCILLLVPVVISLNILCYHTNHLSGDFLEIVENNKYCTSIFDIASGSNVLRGSGGNATDIVKKDQKKDCKRKTNADFLPLCSSFSRLIIAQYNKLTDPNFNFLTNAKFDYEIDNVCLRYKHCASRGSKHNCLLPRLHDEILRICDFSHSIRGDLVKCLKNIALSDPDPDEIIKKMFLDSSSGSTRRQCQFLKESNSIEKIAEVILSNCGPHAEKIFKHHYHVVFPSTICKSGNN